MDADLLFQRESARRQTALRILSDLSLLELWRAYGEPYLVGAVSYNLTVAPDIDLEVFCPDTPRVEDGFAVLAACARHPAVRKARFTNRLNETDQGYYWQLRWLNADGVEWKIDMWSMRADHPGPLSRDLVKPMRRRLTDPTRAAILEIKEALQTQPEPRPSSIQVYRAVMEGGIRSPEDFTHWQALNPEHGLSAWKPE